MQLFPALLWALLWQLTSALVPKKDVKPNVFVFTDISNEPDDAESLVRLLLYSNEVSIKGIVATTSYWLNYTVHDEDIYPILDAYEKVWPNLLKHSKDYPTADSLRELVSTGYKAYGLDAFQAGEPSSGAKKLISAMSEIPQNEKLDILMWGGAGVLAEALKYSSVELIDSVSEKLRVYSISDQDDAGPWIRTNFPKIQYISSLHGFNQYSLSTWVGISGEQYNFFDKGGPDSDLVSKEWLKSNIMSVGPLGKVYPEPMFIMEGDTPSTLFVLPNGLNYPDSPNYGGWGGRYVLVDNTGRSRHYSDAIDYALGKDNETHVSNQATIWRWRAAYQNDFAARMQWTVKDFKSAVHEPIIIVNGSLTYEPSIIEAAVDSKITIDASKSYDLNSRLFTFKWFHYREISLTQANILEVPEIPITKENEIGSKVSFKVPTFKEACHSIFGRPLQNCKEYHIVLEVTNDGTPSMSSYRRFIIKTNQGENEFEEVELAQNFFNAPDHDEL